MKKIFQTMFLILLLLVGAVGVQAATLTELFNGASITAGDKLFDNWSFDFYDSGDGRILNSDNIEVTPLNDGGMNPGPGLSFSVLNGEFDVTGDGIYNYVDLTFGFRASVLDPSLLIKDNSLQLTSGSLAGGDDLGFYILESIGTAAGQDDLGTKDVEFSMLFGNLYDKLTDSAAFMPQHEIWVTKNILVWSVLDTETASLQGFEQRFSQTVVPEPSTWAMLILGVVGLVGARRARWI